MITYIELDPSKTSAAGLAPATLERLAKVVVLAGPNGHGKTRYLSIIKKLATDCAQLKFWAVDEYPRAKEHIERRLAKIQSSRKASADAKLIPPIDPFLHEEKSLRQESASLARRFRDVERVKFSNEGPHGVVAPVIWLSAPRIEPQIFQPTNLSPAQIGQWAATVKEPGIHSPYQHMLAYLTQAAHHLWNGMNRRFETDAKIKEQHQDATGLVTIIHALLRKDFSPGWNGTAVVPLLNERPFAPAELSQGEQILLAWAIAFHTQGTSLQNAIALFDEPEAHLHADICIQTLSRLKEALGQHGQIWMATHSVPIISHMGIDSLYLVRDAKIARASRNADAVVNSLLGGTDGRERLMSFLADADGIANTNFLLECLMAPGVAPPASADKQQLQFTRLVEKKIKERARVRILDFAAGTGRFAVALRLWLADEANRDFRCAIDYHAYSYVQQGDVQDEKNYAACVANVDALGQPSGTTYVWDSVTRLLSFGQSSFDLIVLSNVLHEIPPTLWPRTFEQIAELAAEDASLVIMEDLYPSAGELPHPIGYVVLDDVGLTKLLGCAPIAVEKQRKRVMVAEFPARKAHATNESRCAAIEHVRRQALEEIERIRAANGRTHEDGKRHAFFAMQYANATLANDQLCR